MKSENRLEFSLPHAAHQFSARELFLSFITAVPIVRQLLPTVSLTFIKVIVSADVSYPQALYDAISNKTVKDCSYNSCTIFNFRVEYQANQSSSKEIRKEMPRGI